MTIPSHNWTTRNIERNPLINDALNFNKIEERQYYIDAVASFSPGQKSAYDTITTIIDNGRRPNTFFLQGPAGTGKTFLYQTLCNLYRSQGKIVLCAASSGIAALLLSNGRTAHSLFNIPINSNEDSRCRMPGNSNIANLIRQTHLIIWDEVTMQNKYNFAAVDKTLRWLMDSSDFFGGIPVVLGGDFAQILPVVKRGRREQTVSACIRSWSEWESIQPLFLTQNMRVILDNENERFSQWLSQLPYNNRLHGVLTIPEWITVTENRKEFREFVYPLQRLHEGDLDLFMDRAILSSTNISVNTFNNEIADLRGAESHEYIALDKVQNDDSGMNSDVPLEVLHSYSGSGTPLGKLNLQVGMPVMQLRNLHPKVGLCNGTRLIITRLFDNAVKGRIILTISGFHGEEHYIHRIDMTSSEDLPFTLIRAQLPLRPCFSMTINKSQGQTLQRVGVDLSTPVFSHRQLYVALSRVRNFRNLIILLPAGSQRMTDNIVYPEVLMRPDEAEN